MATPATFLQQARDLISTTLFGANHRGEMISDYGADADSFNSGETKYQIRTWVESLDDEIDSNTTYKTIGVEIQVFHQTIYPGNEVGYTSGAMLTNQLALVDPVSWRALSSVYDIEEQPTIDGAPEMDGNVIFYTMSLTVRLA